MMSRSLRPPDGRPRMLSPTTYIKIAQRMLSASHVVSGGLPVGFHSAPVLEVLLSLYLFEDDAAYVSKQSVTRSLTPDPAVVDRWLTVLLKEGLIEESHDLLALTPSGFAKINGLIEQVYDAQRALD